MDGLALAFTAAATKTTLPGGSQAPSADASRLGEHWRERIRQRLTGLASAWRDEAAWTGMTRVGGLDLPAQGAGVVALNEVIVHSWDIAVASGQRFECEPAPSWGSMLSTGKGYLSQSVWYAILPGLFLTLTIFALDAVAHLLRGVLLGEDLDMVGG